MLLVFVIVSVCASAPLPPRWPEAWSAHWTEHTPESFTRGETLYNATGSYLVWTRASSRGDLVCSSALGPGSDTECQHIVVHGRRYVYFPVLAQCCLCCSEGGEMLQPDFLADAVFAGEQKYYGQTVYVWESPSSTYYESASRQWVALFSRQATYAYVTEWSEAVHRFQLPAVCLSAADCPADPCTAIRAGDAAARGKLAAEAFSDRFGY